jgi:hypothetical protein
MRKTGFPEALAAASDWSRSRDHFTVPSSTGCSGAVWQLLRRQKRASKIFRTMSERVGEDSLEVDFTNARVGV